MAIRVEGPDGRVGTLDVAALAAEQFNGTITGVQDGLVHVRTAEGDVVAFQLAQWAEANNMTVVSMEGFNSPDTALDQPPTGMNYIDQAAFYQDGMDMGTLQELFPQAMKRSDGRVVVLDSDGLWKTMWSPYLEAPKPMPSIVEQALQNSINDPRLVMRTSGITFFYALAGAEPKTDKRNNFTIPSLVNALRVISRNAPYENKYQIGRLLNQTTGLDPWKFYNALLAPDEVGEWLKRALKRSSFQFRMDQADMAEVIVAGLRSMAHKEFVLAMKDLVSLEETKKLLINLKQLFQEFITFLVNLDLLRDISKTTGLNEWIALNEDQAFDKSKLPPMPEFVERFVMLLRWMMPIVQENTLAFAKGKAGFKAIISLMSMIDNCIYSLAGVPDSSAKYKMFMALKNLQTKLESKLAFIYHPNPEDNKDGLKENPFMRAKTFYSTKREELYRLCQLPRESWNNTLLESLRKAPNIEQFYDTLDPSFATVMKSFAAMDVAYDMQPWADVNHAERTHDPFSQYNESFGLPPPEAGYLAKNSPRAVQNISETLVEAAGVLSERSETDIKELLRNPFLMSNLIKTLMIASVNREVGTIEVLSKLGMTADNDPYASPDAHRIWEDPEVVQNEMDKQIEELMGSLAMEAAMQNQQQEAQNQEAQSMQEAARDEGEAPNKAGSGPAGPQQRAVPMRR